MLMVKDFTYSLNGSFNVHANEINLPAGSLTFLFGRNGSGKSTLLSGLAKSFPDKSAYLPTNPAASSEVTGYDICDILNVSTSSLESTLRVFEADTNLLTAQLANLSTGQRKLVWLSLALNLSRDFIFLDEPTSNLDLCYTQRLASLVPNLQTNGKSIFIATHDFAFAKVFEEEKAYLMNGGKVWTEKSVQETLSSQEFAKSFNLVRSQPDEKTGEKTGGESNEATLLRNNQPFS